jgi:parallel beta-helix repeat protein
LDPPTTDIKKDGKVVGITDRVYSVAGSSVKFDDVLVQGDLSGKLEYNGKTIEATNPVKTYGFWTDGNHIVENSSISGSVYGIYVYGSGNPDINNSTISGGAQGIYNKFPTSSFRIGSSQIKGGHNGV